MKNRCGEKYESNPSNTTRVKFFINKDLKHLITTAYPYIHWPHTWHKMIRTIELCKREIKIWQVRWDTPYSNTLKLNTDCNALNNPGKIWGWGILRDPTCSLVYAFSNHFGDGTNNQSETLVAMHDIE